MKQTQVLSIAVTPPQTELVEDVCVPVLGPSQRCVVAPFDLRSLFV